MSNAKWKQKLAAALPQLQMEEDVPLSRLTTFRVGGPAALVARPGIEETALLVETCRREEIPFFVMGRGSNLLASDEGYDGVLIVISEAMSDVRLLSPDGEAQAGGIPVPEEAFRFEREDGTPEKWVLAEAGAALSWVASFALEKSLSGLEFAAGIPGSVGGAVVMNAGAYGGEMKDVTAAALLLESDGCFQWALPDTLEMGYRTSAAMKSGALVMATLFGLSARNPSFIRERMADLRQRRIDKQPLELPSAGSTFKRPEGDFAGRLIEAAGLRGFRIGDAMVSEKHCGFVVNAGTATAEEIRSVIREVQKRIFEQSGIMLEPEVRFLGFEET